MKKGNKLTASMTAFAVVAAMALPMVASADTVSFSDISSSYAATAIQDLASQGILNGAGNGQFNPKGNITRQDMAIVLAKALKLDVSKAPSTPTFSDVPASNYAYAYVEAAAKAGLIKGQGNGAFGYGQHLSRVDLAIMLVNALGVDATGAASNLNFTDNSKIAYGKDQVGYAVKAGLVHGMGDGTFNPTGLATREQVAAITENFLKVQAGQGALKLTASSTNVAIGQKVQFSVTGTTDAVSYSVDKNGVIDASGNFVGTAAGTATVTATVDGKTLTQAVSVYGTPAAIQISTPKTLAANSTSQEDLTVTVVDANGNAVNNFNGTVDLGMSSPYSIKLVDANGATQNSLTGVSVTNGVAKFTVQSNVNVAGLSTTITASNLKDASGNAVSGISNATATVSTAAQVATSIKVTAPKTVSVNQGGNTTFAVEVLDQDGNDMMTGTYGLTVSISGAGTFAGASTTPITVSYTGNNNAANPAVVNVPFYWNQGVAGAINFTVSANGLTSGTGTTNAVVTQDIKKLAVSTTSTTSSFVQGAASTSAATYKVDGLDANGNSVGLSGTTTGANTIYVYDANGNVATNVAVQSGGGAAGAGTATLVGNTFSLYETTKSAAHAGTYTVVVKNTTDNLTQSDAVTVTEKAGSATHYTVTPDTNYVTTANPTTNVKVQLVDDAGNAVAQSGVAVVFDGTDEGAHVLKVNGNDVTTAGAQYVNGVTVKTDANGVATASYTAQGYDGDVVDVNATVASLQGPATAPKINVKYAVTSAVALDLTEVTSGSSTSTTAGQALKFDIALNDAYGAAITSEQDNLKVTFSDADAVTGFANGVTLDSTNSFTGSLTAVTNALAGVTAKKAGTFTVTITDLSVPNATPASASMYVAPGQVNGFALFDANGKQVTSDNEVTVAANTPVALTLKPVDAQGNAVVSNMDYTVNFNGNGGQFEAVSGGTTTAGVTFANGVASKTVYYVNSTAGSYDPTVANYAAVSATDLSAAVTLANPATVTDANNVVYDRYHINGADLTTASMQRCYVVEPNGTQVDIQMAATDGDLSFAQTHVSGTYWFYAQKLDGTWVKFAINHTQGA